VAKAENQRGIFLLGKNCQASLPWDPLWSPGMKLGSLNHCTSMSGQRGDSAGFDLTQMMFKIDEMMAYWSQIGLEPGDVLTTALPPGWPREGRRETGGSRKANIVEQRSKNLGPFEPISSNFPTYADQSSDKTNRAGASYFMSLYA